MKVIGTGKNAAPTKGQRGNRKAIYKIKTPSASPTTYNDSGLLVFFSRIFSHPYTYGTRCPLPARTTLPLLLFPE